MGNKKGKIRSELNKQIFWSDVPRQKRKRNKNLSIYLFMYLLSGSEILQLVDSNNSSLILFDRKWFVLAGKREVGNYIIESWNHRASRLALTVKNHTKTNMECWNEKRIKKKQHCYHLNTQQRFKQKSKG